MSLQIPTPVRAFISAVNNQNEDAFLDAFVTPDGFVDDWGRIFTGREAIKGWSDKEFLGAKGSLTPEEASTDGDQVTLIGDWRSNHANGRSSFTFELEGDAIASMTIREG